MRTLIILLFFLSSNLYAPCQTSYDFSVKGFHLDLRIQVMTLPALKNFALQLKNAGMNTLVMEWEATYPFEKHPLIPNRFAYSKNDIVSFLTYCKSLGIDVIPLQQSFGHVEYILRHYRYKEQREDQKDHSQVCPLEAVANKKLFSELFSELAATHSSEYFHIGGDETYLLGHCPKCSRKAAQEGKSKLYIDHIRMLCDIVISLGKRPVLWADIALKYPDSIQLLPKNTIFIDWNYGWDINRFGDHKKLMESGYEIWGSPSLRSNPDNYFLTQWEKHFKNIRDFIPAARNFGYKGMIMTSWSTSGIYSAVNETSTDIIDLYAIRHVYPLTGFNILFNAYKEALLSSPPLDIDKYIELYCSKNYGFNKQQAKKFWKALTMTPYEVSQGKVISTSPITIDQLLDSARAAAKIFAELQAIKNKKELDHYRLMSDIRVLYLTYQSIESFVNSDKFNKKDVRAILNKLKTLMINAEKLNTRFLKLNEGIYHPQELAQENELRNSKIRILYHRLAGSK